MLESCPYRKFRNEILRAQHIGIQAEAVLKVVDKAVWFKFIFVRSQLKIHWMHCSRTSRTYFPEHPSLIPSERLWVSAFFVLQQDPQWRVWNILFLQLSRKEIKQALWHTLQILLWLPTRFILGKLTTGNGSHFLGVDFQDQQHSHLLWYQ